MGAMRIVLEWGRHPRDLDLHLIREGDYHISYHDMHVSSDGGARLDRDDTKGFGPETITIKDIDEQASYTCYVKNYTDKNSPRSESLSKSDARLTVYGNNQIMRRYRIDPRQNGTTWMVFAIEGGKLIDRNEVGNQY